MVLERPFLEERMLTTDQKEAILRRAGVTVPPFPSGAMQNDEGAPGFAIAVEQWARSIETLYVAYVARRAAQSLRDDEASRQLDARSNAQQQ